MNHEHSALRAAVLAQGLILASATLILTGCGSRPQAGPCIVEIDVTRSSQKAQMMSASWVQPFANHVAAGCRSRAIDASLISANSRAETCPDATLPKLALNGNSENDGALENTRRQDLKKALERLNSCGLAHRRQDIGTDLFGALVKAGSIAGGRPGTRLYVLSDMIEDKEGWDFYKRSFGNGASRALLTQVKHQGLVADGLNGASVTIIGSGVGASMISPSRLAGVQKFWRSYFTAIGAKPQFLGNGAASG